MARRIRGQLLDGLLEILEEPIAGLDRSGAVRYATSKFLEFYPQAQTGQVLWESVDSDPLIRWVSDSLDSTTPEVREQIMAHRPEVLWLARLDPVMGEAGRCSGWILRLKDIQPVERLSQRLDTLVGEVRRRLRDPLAGIKTRLEVLLEGGHRDPDLTVELLKQINDDSNELARLLFSLEDPGEQASVQTSVEGQPADPEAVLNKVTSTFEPLARAKNLALKRRVDLKPGAVASVTDSELERCLINLVDNAVKYTALNGYGEVCVQLTEHNCHSEPGLLVSVDDSGPGIPASERDAVFEQFYRVSDGPTAQLGGTGLGLWRVKEIADKRNGKVWIEDAPQGGSGLRLWFPL